MALSRREKNSATYSIDLKSKLLIAMGSLYWQSTESSQGRRKERGRAGSEARRGEQLFILLYRRFQGRGLEMLVRYRSGRYVARMIGVGLWFAASSSNYLVHVPDRRREE